MKKTAKILSLMLVFSLCFGIVPASAADYTPPTTYIYGDVDFDGAVTVKDATEIQKGVADIVYLIGVQKYLADPDAKGVSVKNATAIQKHVANIDMKNTMIGAYVDMGISDEFSSKLPDPEYCLWDCILVIPRFELDYVYHYTLEDFPEYEFSSISTIMGSEENGYIGYALYLKEPNKDNVYKAIKALDYRFNLDLWSVEPNGFSVGL